METPDGNLAPEFVAVTNTDGDPEGLIRHGNERVLRARFNDARFFWNTDQKRSSRTRADLANVTFQAKLGTYLEKTERWISAQRSAVKAGRPTDGEQCASAQKPSAVAPRAFKDRSHHRTG